MDNRNHRRITRFPRLPRLTHAEEQDLAARRVAGDLAARERLIFANTALALKMAKRFRCGLYERHIEDMTSAAMEGLILGVDHYVPGFVSCGRVVPLAAYAIHWIHDSLCRAAVDVPTIRVPRETVRLIRAVHRGAITDPKKIARHADALGHGRKAMAFAAVGQHGLPRGSCDIAWTDVELEKASTPDVDRARRWLAEQDARHAQVIDLLYPRDGSDPMTVRDAAKKLGYSHQFVSSLKTIALKSLRAYIEIEEAA